MLWKKLLLSNLSEIQNTIALGAMNRILLIAVTASDVVKIAKETPNVCFWKGTCITSLHVKGEDGQISDFIPICDFDIIEDRDDVLNTYEATVKCITQWCNLTYGKEYKAIGYNTSDSLLVMDDSDDCYFYPREYFEILEDNHGILDKERAFPVYDWSHTHVDSV